MTQTNSKWAYCFALFLAVVAGTSRAQAAYLGTIINPYLAVDNQTILGLQSVTLPEPSGVFAQVFNTGTNVVPGFSLTSLGAVLSVTGSPIPDLSQLNPYALGVSAGASAIFPLFVPPNPGTFGIFSEEQFTIRGTVAPGDELDFSIQGASNLYTLPLYSRNITDAGPFDLYFFAEGPIVWLQVGDPGAIFDVENTMGFSIGIIHTNPTSTTSIEILDPVTTFISSPLSTVPAPPTLTQLGIGALCSLGYGWGWRKRSQA
jgi:hypothetical protein